MKRVLTVLLLSGLAFACSDEEVQKSILYQQLKVKNLSLEMQLEQLQGTIAQLQNKQHEANFNGKLSGYMEEGAKLCAAKPNTKFNPSTMNCDEVKPPTTNKEEKAPVKK